MGLGFKLEVVQYLGRVWTCDFEPRWPEGPIDLSMSDGISLLCLILIFNLAQVCIDKFLLSMYKY